MEYFWCFLILKAFYLASAFPVTQDDPNSLTDPKSRSIRQTFGGAGGNLFDSLPNLNRQYNWPSYFGYNPYLTSLTGSQSSAQAASNSNSVNGQAASGAQASAQSSSVGLNQGGAYNQGGYNQGGYNQGGYNQGGYNQGGYNQGNRYNQGAGVSRPSAIPVTSPVAVPVVPVAPVVSTGYQNGASQTDSFSNSESHSSQNSQNINVEALGVPIVNIGLSNTHSNSNSNSGSQTHSINQYGNGYWG